MPELKPALAVLGPTGSGKSDLGLELASRFDGEVVNCDSVQLYRYLNIGTAKVPEAERQGIPHHLIDMIDPDELFTAGDYIRLARPVLRDIANRGRIPVIVGGTGFYYRALWMGLFQGPARNEKLRTRLESRGSIALHRLLNRLDPDAAKRIHANDRQKLIRALEVCVSTHQPITSLHGHGRDALEGFRVLALGLDPPADLLSSRIDIRCARMFEAGLVKEVEGILNMGFDPGSKALESIGYRQALLHLQSGLSLIEAVRLTQISTRQYAKRQRTWFRREQGLHSLRGFGNLKETVEEAKRLAQNFI
ncbi:MAG TPA: tRNA (adenosine(37)-N6)-dimethylallyltransferase MiaA [Bryobacteraceae bacterium]|nr:tRNA (adenosine(37)-N6)-dimethylallyltransferase MiaA [Bryobacteraceae bacterium]